MNNAVLTRVHSFQCMHNKYSIDTKLNVVECAICKKELNPMWVLGQLCSREARAWRSLEVAREKTEKANKKNRCKCEKCGQMTRIQR